MPNDNPQTPLLLFFLLISFSAAAAEDNSVFVCDVIGSSEPPQCIHGHFESAFNKENAKKIWEESIHTAEENAKLEAAFEWFYQHEAHHD